MEVSQQTINRAQRLLRNARQSADAPILEDEIDALALKIAFASSLRTTVRSPVYRVTSGTVGPPSLALAKILASRVRTVLGSEDSASFFDLPVLVSEKLGIEILLLDDEGITGGCVLMSVGGFILLPSDRRLSDLFVCAHELGHLLLLSIRHEREGAVFDVSADVGPRVRSLHEHVADAFARELLISSRGLGIAIQEIRKQFNLDGPIGDIELLYLSRVFGVSFLVMSKRCEALGLLRKGTSAAFYQLLVEKFGGPEQRADMLQLPPRPVIEIAAVPRSVQVAFVQEITSKPISKRKMSFPKLA